MAFLQLSAATLNYDTMILGPVSQRGMKRPTDQAAIDASDRLRGIGVASLIESDPREETWTNSVLPTFPARVLEKLVELDTTSLRWTP
mgnify:CR=1 FL=1